MVLEEYISDDDFGLHGNFGLYNTEVAGLTTTHVCNSLWNFDTFFEWVYECVYHPRGFMYSFNPELAVSDME